LTPYILVITAECGEAQFAKLCEGLKKQKHVECHHEVISNKPPKVAERMIYEYARSARESDYDWIFRIDADMIPLSDSSITDILALASQNNYSSRITTPVLDYYTGRPIYGLHAFKPNAVPDTYIHDSFYLEKWITSIPGLLTVEKSQKNCFFSHGFDPTPKQAIRFGLTRGIKAGQRGPRDGHWITLDHLRKNTIKYPSDNILWMTYLGGLTGLGAIDTFVDTWELVDAIGTRNSEVVSFIQQILDCPSLKEDYLKLSRLLSIHYNTYQSSYETLRLYSKFQLNR